MTFEDDVRRARVPWRCDACGCIIESGDIYRYRRVVSDGDWYSLRWHTECFDLAVAYCDATHRHDEVWDEDGFFDWLTENRDLPNAVAVLAQAEEEGRWKGSR